ncbi:MAG: hypothetical protein ACRCVT_06655 [Leadbetterella sp.]
MKFVLSLCFLLISTLSYSNKHISLDLIGKSENRLVQYAVNQLYKHCKQKDIIIHSSLAAKQGKASLKIIFGINNLHDPASLLLKKYHAIAPKKPESLCIKKLTIEGQKTIFISGFDAQGLMYALLDVAERIRLSKNPEDIYKQVLPIMESPDTQVRAISQYTMNRAFWESKFYDITYWEMYLDNLAKNRFNSFVVVFGYENGGFMAPCYPYFFNTQGFETIRMVGIDSASQQKNINHFRKLIDMCHERGIQFTAGIFDHIYRAGVQGGAIQGKWNLDSKPSYSQVGGVSAENLIPYTKKALSQFIKTFPQLDAILFRIHYESGLKASESDAFWTDVFKTIKSDAPHLKIDLHAKELPESVIDSALLVGIPFRISTKFWMEQMGQPFHATQTNPEKSPRRQSYSDLLRYPKKFNIHWRLWNAGTTRILNWGDPAWVKRFVKETHLYNGEGFEVNEPFMMKMEGQAHDEAPYELLPKENQFYTYEFEKYWLFFKLFGRLGYNPNTDSSIWEREFEMKFGKETGSIVSNAIAKSSEVLPRIIATTYPYILFPMTRGWAEKHHLGSLAFYASNQATDIAQFTGFEEEAKLLISNRKTAKYHQTLNARWYWNTYADLQNQIKNIDKNQIDRNKELANSLIDVRILSYLAKYHACRIPAAIYYNIYTQTQNGSALDSAIVHEKNAIGVWEELVHAVGNHYHHDLKVGAPRYKLNGHWRDELQDLKTEFEELIKLRQNLPSKNELAPHVEIPQVSTYQNLFHVWHKPISKANPNQDLQIQAKMETSSPLESLVLKHRPLNQDVPYESINMIVSNGQYQAIIPKEKLNPRFDLQYYFEIIDTQGHGIIYPDFEKETPYFVVTFIR